MSDIFDMKKKYLKLHRKYAITTIRLGLPSGLTQAIFSMAMIIVQSLTNSFGEMFIAANVIVMRVDGFAMMPNFSFGTAMTTYAGQNVGAGKLDRISKGIKSTCIMGLVYSVAAFVLLTVFGTTIALLFVDASETLILQNVRWFLMINSAFFFPLALVNIVRFTIQGLGFSRLAILAGVCEMAARSIVGLGFVPVFGYIAACFASPIAWICADLFLIPAYLYVMKKLREMLEKDPGNSGGIQT